MNPKKNLGFHNKQSREANERVVLMAGKDNSLEERVRAAAYNADFAARDHAEWDRRRRDLLEELPK